MVGDATLSHRRPEQPLEQEMHFRETVIPEVYLVDLDRNQDDRGFFTRAWCAKEFKAKGLFGQIAQVNISFNKAKHTMRGFHYQREPYAEDKVLRCTRGAIHAIVLDLRPQSAMFKRHVAVQIDAENCQMLVVPKGCANAFLTLEDNTEVTYLISEFYKPEAQAGLRWNDPAFDFRWPFEPSVISPRDQTWANFNPSLRDAIDVGSRDPNH